MVAAKSKPKFHSPGDAPDGNHLQRYVLRSLRSTNPDGRGEQAVNREEETVVVVLMVIDFLRMAVLVLVVEEGEAEEEEEVPDERK